MSQLSFPQLTRSTLACFLWCAISITLSGAATANAQIVIDTMLVRAPGDTNKIWAMIPENYTPANPPAIFVWWHALGGTQYELVTYTEFETLAAQRGWISVCHFGPNDRHWNTRLPQEHCRQLLDFVYERFPFSRDSIYMVGSSMGAAAPQVWHNNNCGPNDYLIAAAAGGSQILDCELRQRQYLSGFPPDIPADTNRSMRAAFGGIPCDSDTCDSSEFEYHRYSAVYLADTTKSMHFNSLTIPVYNTWGNSDLERFAYGDPGAIWLALRQGFAPTVFFQSEIDNHGLWVMNAPEIIEWLAQFRANWEPDTLTLAADEDDEYYWTRVSLNRELVMGRWGAARDVFARQLDLNLIRNIDTISVDVAHFNLAFEDIVHGQWRQRDELVQSTVVELRHVNWNYQVQTPSGPAETEYNAATMTLHVTLNAESLYTLTAIDAVEGRSRVIISDDVNLIAAYPNPFNGTVQLTIETPIASSTTVQIYTILGELAKSVPAELSPGLNRLSADMSDLASGSYYVRLRGQTTKPLKLTLLK